MKDTNEEENSRDKNGVVNIGEHTKIPYTRITNYESCISFVIVVALTFYAQKNTSD